MEMEQLVEGQPLHPPENNSVTFDDGRHLLLVKETPKDFDAWTTLVTEIEKEIPDDLERISQVYNSFLSEFPLCYGYWKKYADHMARLRTVGKAVEVYERAIQSATYSVGLWVNYCSFAILAVEDLDDVRRLFERGLSFVGKDYCCHLLWDKYIEFEYSLKQWSCLAHIYIRTLRFPTRKLHRYYESFRKLSAILEGEMQCQNSETEVLQTVSLPRNGLSKINPVEDDKISTVIDELVHGQSGLARPETLNRYLSTGEDLYKEANRMNADIKCFESRIKRPYFHVKPLDDDQLENWHQYLDFIESQGDFDWTVKLHERCLISCANYPEFWIRYVELMEAKGGREIACSALFRATQIFLKREPQMHLFCAMFKEQIRDISDARAEFLQMDSDSSSDFIENVTRYANMERRLGNIEEACMIYEKALDMGKEKQNSQSVCTLYAKYSQFKYRVTGNVDTARDVLMKGIQQLPYCRLLLELLLQFEMMHGGPKQIAQLDIIVGRATAPLLDGSQNLSIEDREHISNLFLEFVDLHGDIHEIKKAWACHRKLFSYQMRPTFSFKYTAVSNGNMDTVKVGRQDMPLQETPNIQSNLSMVSWSHGHNEVKKAASESLEVPEHAVSKLDSTLHNVCVPDSEPKDLEHSEQDSIAQDMGVLDSEHRDVQNSFSLQVSKELQEAVNQDHVKPDIEPRMNLGLPTLETLVINSQEEETQQMHPNPSHSCKADKLTSSPDGRVPQNLDSNEVSAVPNLMQTQHDMAAQAHREKYSDPLQIASNSNLPEKHRQSKSQTDTHLHTQPPMPIHGGNWRPINHTAQTPSDPNFGFHGYAQAQQPQQCQVTTPSPYMHSDVHAQMLLGQRYPYHPQSLQNLATQQANLAQNQYAGAQVYLADTHGWPVQNMQQSFVSPHQLQQNAQPGPQPQAHSYQYPVQSNELGSVQSNSGFPPHLWHYYYQQQQQQQLQQHLQLQALQQQQLLQQQQQQHQLMHQQLQQPQVIQQHMLQQSQQQMLQQQQQQHQQARQQEQDQHLQQQHLQVQVQQQKLLQQQQQQQWLLLQQQIQQQPQQQEQQDQQLQKQHLQLQVQQQMLQQQQLLHQQQIEQRQQQQLMQQQMLLQQQPQQQELQQQQQQKEPQKQEQQDQQQLEQQQQQLQQQQQQQQHLTSSHIQEWSSYYSQLTNPTQYYASNQYGQESGQQAIESQVQEVAKPDGEPV